jgi:DNA mismatch endonuclease (patch repair protein)
MPKSNNAYWQPKLERNVKRDLEHLSALRAAGWKALVIWECETASEPTLSRIINGFLG